MFYASTNRTTRVTIPHFIIVGDVFLFSVLLGMEITYPSGHTKNMDVQHYGGIVANIHIRDAVMHHGVCGAVNFKLKSKRKRGKKHDTNVKIGSDSKDIHNKRVMV